MPNLSLYEDKVCRYFLKPGIQNSREVLEAVARRAEELNIKKVLIATNTGKTAFCALEILGKEVKIVAITHAMGFAKPNFQEMDDESRAELKSKGVSVLTCTHALAGIGRGIRNKLSTYQVDEIVAYVLRMFGQGTKVAVELALMAADAGLVRTDEDVISIGGTARGADTALVIQPANSSNVFDIIVREIICKPSTI